MTGGQLPAMQSQSRVLDSPPGGCGFQIMTCVALSLLLIDQKNKNISESFGNSNIPYSTILHYTFHPVLLNTSAKNCILVCCIVINV